MSPPGCTKAPIPASAPQGISGEYPLRSHPVATASRTRRAAAGWAVALAVALGLPIAQADNTERPERADRADGVLVGRVVRVADGDSLTVLQGAHRVSVRLMAVDAPELDQAHGSEAREALRRCAFGRAVAVEVKAKDRHGRLVGRVEAAGQDCGFDLVRAGWAWHAKAFAQDQSDADRAAYAAAERAARRQRLGLWQATTPTPPWVWRRQNPRAPTP